jgi:two-component system sensor histidine kinase RegB
MTDIMPDFRHPRRYVRLDTILRLRAGGAGQLATIFIVSEGLDFEVPVIPCVVIIGFSSLLNLVLQIVQSGPPSGARYAAPS